MSLSHVPCPRIVRGSVAVSLALGLLWVATPLIAQKSVNATRSNLQNESFSRGHLRMLNLAILRYTIDNDGLLPALDSPAKFRDQLKAMRLSTANLICPLSNQNYAMNGRLAGKKRSDIKQPTKTLMLWSPRPLSDGEYLVLDANGQVKRVSSGEFAKMRRN